MSNQERLDARLKRTEAQCVLQPTCTKHALPRADKFDTTEFEIQAWLFYELGRLIGTRVRGEVPAPNGRLDLVVYGSDGPLLVIEVKRGTLTHSGGVKTVGQIARYRCYGVPLFMVYSMSGAQRCLAYVKNLVS